MKMIEKENGTIISVIIPTYRRADEVGYAVKSAMEQTLKNIEIIVVDDNPPESQDRKKTREIISKLKKIDPRIIYVEHSQNFNGSVARNSGLKIARGKIIAFLDDDDRFLPEKLEKQFVLLSSLGPEYAGVISNCCILRDGKTIRMLDVSGEENGFVDVLACQYNMGSGSNIFIRRKVFEDVGNFDERLLRHQDYDFLVRVFMKYKIKKISEALFLVEQRSSHLNTPNLKKMEEAKTIYLEKYKDSINKLSRSDQDYIFFSHYISLCEIAIRCKDHIAKKKYLNKAKQYSNLSIRQIIRMKLIEFYTSFPLSVRKMFKIGK